MRDLVGKLDAIHKIQINEASAGEIDERIVMLDDAQDNLRNAIEQIEGAVEGTERESYVKAYLIDKLRICLDNDHGFLSNDINIEQVKDMLREEVEEDEDEKEEEVKPEGGAPTEEAKKCKKDKMMEALTGTEYDVTAQSFNRTSGKPNAKPRTETINIKTNRLFKGVRSIVDIKKAYEAFWNELNPNSEEVVFVQSIKPSGQTDENVQDIPESTMPMTEGTWSVPFTKRKAARLKELMSAPLPQKKATKVLYSLVGDDTLFDDLDALEKEPEKDVRPIVKKYITALLKLYKDDPDGFKDKLTPEAAKILNSI